MINFCTLFDSNYLSRGLALYESLKQHSSDFHLYVVAFDDKCYEFLKNLQYDSLTPISLKDFEDPRLLEVKPTRSIAEYCWTCTASVVRYCINTFELSSCTYIDADMVFYADPAMLIEEIGDNSIAITEHRYSREYNTSKITGVYCVQFVYFKNDERGLTALNWWRERCLEWCYAYVEDGKFGDQRYLDDWLTRFPGTHVVQHLGCGIAPWNVQQYRFEKNGNKTILINKKDGSKFPVVFFHYHGLKFFTDNIVQFTGALYYINEEVKQLFYIPYTHKLIEISEKLKATIPSTSNGARKNSPSSSMRLKEYVTGLFWVFVKYPSYVFNARNFAVSKHFHFYSIKK